MFQNAASSPMAKDRFILLPIIVNGTLADKIYWEPKETKMENLKKKFKQKVLAAQRRRGKECGNVEYQAPSIIVIPETKAKENLSEYKGYQFVSKKS